MSWIETYTAKRFDFANLDANDISILDIAHALSNICRFTGHCRDFYSVAEHCVIMSKMGHWTSDVQKFEALMHDAHEAYIGDMSAPLKYVSPEFKAFEKRVETVVRRRFGLPEQLSPEIKNADIRMLAMEAKDVMHGNWRAWESINGVIPAQAFPDFLTPKDARIKFLTRFAELYVFKGEAVKP